jgi:ribosome-binding protein aMBF1 (putative translation factor)
MTSQFFDPTPVVLRRTLTREEKVKKGVLVSEVKHGGGQNKTSSDLDKRKVEAGTLAPPKMPLELAQAIQKARCEQKLSREQLANKLAVPKAVIDKLETPNAMLTGITNLTLVFTKLNSVLKTSFKKPKNTVLAPEEDNKNH